jgi:hypothetical protein
MLRLGLKPSGEFAARAPRVAALHRQGAADEAEFAVQEDDGPIRGSLSIPAGQAWFFTPEWLAGKRGADEGIAARHGIDDCSDIA